MIENLGLINF